MKEALPINLFILLIGIISGGNDYYERAHINDLESIVIIVFGLAVLGGIIELVTRARGEREDKQ